MVIGVAAAAGPLEGDVETGEGERSVMTKAPATIDRSVPRLTVRFLGPRAVEADMANSVDALVGAAELSLPPNVHAPNCKPGFDTEKTIPSLMSTPPTLVSGRLCPRDTRRPKAGRVRFNPVALAGKTRISAAASPPGLTCMSAA